MEPVFIAASLAVAQMALFALCLLIAFATPTGRRNVAPTILIFGWGAFGGFLGAITWYGILVVAALIAAAGVTLLEPLGDGRLVLGTLCLAYLLGTVSGGRFGWRVARRDPLDAPGTRIVAANGGEAK
jgi:hypothetical protein